MKILCYSRSYLTELFPKLSSLDNSRDYYFIVQNVHEKNIIESYGGKVVFNIQQHVNHSLRNKNNVFKWEEPEDFKKVTNFNFSSLYSDRYLIYYNHKTRLNIAGSLYIGLKKLFLENKFDYFIGEPVAIFSTNLIYYFCLKNSIKVRFWNSCYFPGFFYFSSGMDTTTPISNSTLNDTLISNLKTEIQAYSIGIRDDKKGPVYHYSFSKKNFHIFNFLKQRKGKSPLILEPGFYTFFLQILKLTRAWFLKISFPYISDYQAAASFYEHLFYFKCLNTSKSIYNLIPSIYDSNNVVFPLQYEPEASLLYFAPQYSNQLNTVELLLKILPNNKILWVKEHPNQFGALGINKWRKLQKKYHNLRFVYGRESGRELIKKSALIITISSSAGMDSLLIGKRVVVLGNVFYRNFFGSIPIDSITQLEEVLNDQNNYNYEEDLSQFNHNVESLTLFAAKSYLGDPQPSDILYSENNLNNLIQAFNKEFI